MIYPVGSIYTSTQNVSPAIFLGGTWTPIKDTFLMCAGDTYKAGTIGGASSVTLRTENLPAHVHGLNSHAHSVPAHTHGLNKHIHSIPALSGTTKSAGAHAHKGYYVIDLSSGSEKARYRTSASSTSTASDVFTTFDGIHTHSVTTTANTSGQASGSTASSSVLTSGTASGNTASTGFGTAFGILPPYKTVYVWERTA